MPIHLGEPFSFDQTLEQTGSHETGTDKIRTRIAIVGAGLAGLTCAYRLTKDSPRTLRRCDLVLLERETCPGGRVRSLRVNDVVLNLGAVAFQPEHYQSYMALLVELGLDARVTSIPRRRMAFGYGEAVVCADNLSLFRDVLCSAGGRGLFSVHEYLQLLRFYFFQHRITAPDRESAFMELHEISVAEWARGFGFDETLQRKFVRPLTHYCFKGPEKVSAAFGVFLLAFNLGRPANLAGGFGQLTDALASRLADLLTIGVAVIRVERRLDGFCLTYRQSGAEKCLHAEHLVLAVPANVAATLMPEMRNKSAQVNYGDGKAMIVAGKLKQDVDLHMHVRVGNAGEVIYGGEVQQDGAGRHFANVLTYTGDGAQEAVAAQFQDGRMEIITKYDMCPAVAAPQPGQQPLPIEWGDGLFLAGDCTGLFPSQEAAVSSGEQVAGLLQGYLNHG